MSCALGAVIGQLNFNGFFVCLFCLFLEKTQGISCACLWFWFCYDSKVKGLLIIGRLVVRSAIILVIKQIRLLLRGRPFNLWYNHRSNCTPLSHINIIIHLMSLSLLGWLRKLLLTRFRGVGWVCVFPIFPPSVTPLSWLPVLWSRAAHEGGIITQIYHDKDRFYFSQGHLTKNQPVGVPV